MSASRLVRAAVAAIATLLLNSIWAWPTSGELAPVGQLPKPRGDIVGDTPAVTIAYDGSYREMARRTYRSTGSGPTWRCSYFAVTDVPGSLDPKIEVLAGAITPEVDQAVALTCWDEENRQVYQQIFLFDPAQPFGVIVPAADAALLARELLPLPDPDIVTSPPAGRPQLVGVPTWFRVGDAWQTFSATATLAGVSATVTATPSQVVWDPGDGSDPITCDGPGAAYDPANPAATSDCAHTYIRASAAGATALTATITYDVAWTATDGSADTLDPVTRTATVALTIGEVQALVR